MKKVKLTSLMLIVFGLSISLTACGGSSSNVTITGYLSCQI
jgi:uncharacterized lipoprotein YehR (DUF1307 family)